jgi:hypothetical protein
VLNLIEGFRKTLEDSLLALISDHDAAGLLFEAQLFAVPVLLRGARLWGGGQSG